MRLKSLLSLLVAVFAVSVYADIDATLLKKMASVGSDEYLPVIVAMKEQPSIADIKSSLRGNEVSITNEAISILKNKAEQSQLFLKSICSQRDSQVKNVNSFWIANMMGMEATPAMIREIASQPEVETVFLDAEQIFINYEVGTPMRDAWGLAKIGSDQVNASGNKGKGILVAVIDTGVNYNHNDLAGRVIKGKDFANNDADPMDGNGHGSHCAGTVAGTTYGVAPEATILAVQVLSAGGSGSWQGVANGVQYVADYKGEDGKRVDVASMSLGGGAPIQQVLKTAFENAIATGIHFAVAAGNSGPNAKTIGTPGDLKEVISVGATDTTNTAASFSSRGPVVAYGTPYYTKPDVAAPGVNITSCWKGSATASNTISGTSMATPHVAGLCALILAAKGSMTTDNLKLILESTATELGDSGKDNTYGSGLVNAVKCVSNELIGRVDRLDIEKEFVFPIAGDGSIVVKTTKNNPLWDMSARIQLTVMEPAGLFNGSFKITAPGKPEQKGQFNGMKTGVPFKFNQAFSVYEGDNSIEFLGKYTGTEKAAQGKLMVKISTEDFAEGTISRGERFELEIEVQFPISADGKIHVEKVRENPLWDMNVQVTNLTQEPQGMYTTNFVVKSDGKPDQTGNSPSTPAGTPYVFPKLFVFYEGENKVILDGTYSGPNPGTTGKSKVKIVAK